MEETKMDKLTTGFAEYICDRLCHYTHILSKEELENKCLECKTGKFICDILNEYNRINNFDKTETCKLLKELSKIQQLKEREELLMDYIMRHAYSCPIKDDVDINLKECVGFEGPGCRECIMRHLKELR